MGGHEGNGSEHRQDKKPPGSIKFREFLD